MTSPRTLLARAKRDGNPVLDGERATFVWQGDEPPALRADFNNWGMGGHPAQLHAAGPRLWTYTVILPADAYIEYGFFQWRRLAARSAQPAHDLERDRP